jgi:hypothetical protein
VVSGAGFYEARQATHAAENARRTAVRATAKFDIIRAAVESPKSGFGSSEITEELLTELDRLVDLDIAPKRVLWFDTHPEHNVSETTAFQKLGFHVVGTTSLPDAVRKAASPFDLVITQFGHHQDGTEPNAYALKQSLEAAGRKSVPIIIYSTGVTAAYACASQKDGFYDETDKPAVLFEVVLRAAQGKPAHPRCGHAAQR